MNRRWAQGGFEPSLDELLDEPIAALLRRRDRLSEAEVRAAVGVARQRLAVARCVSSGEAPSRAA